jgi:Family of unknown function (DUF6084)
MPDLDFTVVGVKPANHGITPLLEFELRVENHPPEEPIQAVALHVQIQIECPKRSYSLREKEQLLELFGKPERWGQTLRTRLWTHVDTTVPPFNGSTNATLLVPCTYDLKVASAKYFHALEDGEVALNFLYSGSVFYQADGGRLQVSRISWNKEGTFRMPVSAWRDTIDQHYPNSAWFALDREVFNRLDAFRRGLPAPTWENAIERLMDVGTLEPKEAALS